MRVEVPVPAQVVLKDREWAEGLVRRCPQEYSFLCQYVLDLRNKEMLKLAASQLRDNETLEVIRGKIQAYENMYRLLVATANTIMEDRK